MPEGQTPSQGVVEAGIRVLETDHHKADVAASCAKPTQSPFVADPS